MANTSEPTPIPVPLLVGRGSEQRLLRDQLTEATTRQGRLVLLGGVAGIGKTSLAKDLAREAADRGLLVLTGHCYDLSATPPYGPWLDLATGYRPNGDLPPLPPALVG